MPWNSAAGNTLWMKQKMNKLEWSQKNRKKTALGKSAQWQAWNTPGRENSNKKPRISAIYFALFIMLGSVNLRSKQLSAGTRCYLLEWKILLQLQDSFQGASILNFSCRLLENPWRRRLRQLWSRLRSHSMHSICIWSPIHHFWEKQKWQKQKLKDKLDTCANRKENSSQTISTHLKV